ncbi:hypothetical protein EOD42_08995 [Rhodovarius crocodyli]|uniref:Uncharacterized protein n=1 Tax=Rhodovarius crocodyli TaxID=1979269 RepID=A0A437MJY3_9PROT|nr:hypothetical protein [Rhodovarius crocodyli]RVT97916.1 hypothetical protein EOD42_08995 [Rhodovarius crocodyli]
MSSPFKGAGAVAVSWYDADSYLAVRAMMSDAHVLPATFDKFKYSALKHEEDLRRKGIAAVRVYLDIDKFPRFCRERNLQLDAKGRMEYAAFVAAKIVDSHNAGQA